MKNFLRALRYILPYRRRLFVSILCAAFAAVLWGLNFTAVYPFLKLLSTEQSLQTWIESSIDRQQALVGKLDKESDELSKKEDETRRGAESKHKEKAVRDAAAASYKIECRLET